MIALCAGLLASALGAAPDLEPEHTGNPIYKALVTEGLELAGATVPFPPPLLRDGQAPEAQYAALRSVAKSKGKADEMLRNAVTAPSVLKIRDLPARDGVVLRGTDVLFVIHGDLDVLDPTGAVLSSGELVEAEKIAFEAKPIPRDDLERRELALIKPSFGRFPVEWYLHATG
ncbi:MAG: hypothetical protein IRY99_24400, partial [Isosphaeraceae bacterium]|nr:hypothetical protein [Isosphaeraceae bacterium]